MAGTPASLSPDLAMNFSWQNGWNSLIEFINGFPGSILEMSNLMQYSWLALIISVAVCFIATRRNADLMGNLALVAMICAITSLTAAFAGYEVEPYATYAAVGAWNWFFSNALLGQVSLVAVVILATFCKATIHSNSKAMNWIGNAAFIGMILSILGFIASLGGYDVHHILALF